MLRAGKLDREITIERETETVAPSGAVSKVWAPVATVRAELVQQSADEYLAGFGEAEGDNVVFRVRYLAGITTADRVSYAGDTYDIDGIAEFGRRKILEIRAKKG